MNKHIYNKGQWKSGVILEIEGAKVEIIENFFQRVLKIRIGGKNKIEALAIIRYHINDLHDSFENLHPDEMVPCNCEECIDDEQPHFYKYELLKKYEREGIPEIRCEKSKILEKVNVLRLIKDINITEKIITEKKGLEKPKIDGIYIEQLVVGQMAGGDIKNTGEDRSVEIGSDAEVEGDVVSGEKLGK